MPESPIHRENAPQLHSEGAKESATPQSPTSASPTSPSERPPSGDVQSLLAEMDGGKKKQEANHTAQRREQMLKLVNEITALLPPGSRPATADEVVGRTLPPGATPILIPTGKTISKVLLERCVKVGLFPVPPLPGKIFDVIDESDRQEIVKIQANQMEQLKQREQMLQQMNHHMMSGGLPAGAEFPKQTNDMEEFARGLGGLRYPTAEDFKDQDTVKQWDQAEFKNDVAQSISNAVIIESAKYLVLTYLAAFWSMNLTVYFLRYDIAMMAFALAGVFSLTYLVIKYFVHSKASGYTFPEEMLEIPQVGKNAVVTGGASGIGVEIVKQLYKMGISKIFVLEKSQMLALKDLDCAKKELIDENVDIAEWGSVVEVFTCDLSDLKAVFEFTSFLATKKLPIHYLVLNNTEFTAKKPTGNEIDHMFMSNYLGHFLLAKQLFVPINHAGGRVITVGSQIYSLVKNLDLHESVLNRDSEYSSSINAFVTSKALGILFTKMLAQRMSTLGKKDPQTGEMIKSNAMAFAFNPGVVDDKLTKQMHCATNPIVGTLIYYFLYPIMKTPKEAAQTAFKLLFAPSEQLQSGGYYNEGIFEKTYASCNVTHPEIKNNIVKLWQMSNVMVYEHSFEARMQQQSIETARRMAQAQAQAQAQAKAQAQAQAQAKAQAQAQAKAQAKAQAQAQTQSGTQAQSGTEVESQGDTEDAAAEPTEEQIQENPASSVQGENDEGDQPDNNNAEVETIN